MDLAAAAETAPVQEVLAPTIDLPEPVPDEAVGMTLGRYKLRENLGGEQETMNPSREEALFGLALRH